MEALAGLPGVAAAPAIVLPPMRLEGDIRPGVLGTNGRMGGVRPMEEP
jgi:hypothetical protein